MSSIVEALKTYVLTYSQLAAGAPVLVDTLGKEPVQYAVVPLPGARILNTYLDDVTEREYPFAIQSMESTVDDLTRIANSGFYEALAEWIEAQNKAGILPTLAAGKTATKIEAIGQPILFEFGESGTGVYQLQCRLTYEQQP